MNDTDFGKVLRKMRTDSGKTVPEVSEHLTSLGYKAATQTIYGWERGLSQPNPDPFLAMCKFYGVTDVLSYFGSDPIDTKKSPSATEAAPGEEDVKLMMYLRRGVYDMGFLPEGADLTDRQVEALLGVCAILHAIFDE